MELLKQKLNHLSLKYKILSLIITGILIVFLSGLLTTELVSRSYEKNCIARSLLRFPILFRKFQMNWNILIL